MSINNWPPAANFYPDLARPYYVIIGMGFSALLNHVTMRFNERDSRIGKLPVLHIGKTDPWKLYNPIPMGQWPNLLTLPAFINRPVNCDHKDFLPSTEFVRMLEQEWEALAQKCPFFAVDGTARSIKKIDSGYEIEVAGQTPIKVVAEKVDICGGPGPPRRLTRGQVCNQQLWSEYENGTSPDHPWPRLQTSEQFLGTSCLLPTRGSSIHIYGGGPTSAWCVERAMDLGLRVTWLSREPLRNAFPPTRRNDRLARQPLDRIWKNGEYVVETPLLPSRRDMTFAEGFQLSSLDLNSNEVEVAITPYTANATRRWVDGRDGHIEPRTSGRFVLVVIATGHLKSVEEVGSWANIVRDLIPANIRPNLVRDKQNRAVAIQSSGDTPKLANEGRLKTGQRNALRTTSFLTHLRPLPQGFS